MAAAAVCSMMPLCLPLHHVSEDLFEREVAEARPPAARPSFGGFSDSYERISALGASRATSRAEPKRRSALGGRPRPTQRRPIDDFTTVPADLFERLESAAREARNRSALHRLAFNDSGERYLLHTKAEDLRAARLAEAEPTASTAAPVEPEDLRAARPAEAEPMASTAAPLELEDDVPEEHSSPLRAEPPQLFRSLSSCAMELDLAAESTQRWQVACA